MVNNQIALLQSGLGRLYLTLSQDGSLAGKCHFAFGSESKAQKLLGVSLEEKTPCYWKEKKRMEMGGKWTPPLLFSEATG